MESLGVLVPILASSRFNDVYKAFSHKYFMFSTETPDQYPDARQHARAYWDEMQNLYIDLLNVARTSLGTEELDEKARKAILEDMPKKDS